MTTSHSPILPRRSVKTKRTFKHAGSADLFKWRISGAGKGRSKPGRHSVDMFRAAVAAATEQLRDSISAAHALQREMQMQMRDLADEVAALQSQLAQTRAAPVDALAGAKARGASYTQAEWHQPENLTLADAAHYSHRSDRVINEARNRGDLYALVVEGKTRGFRYPQWQFDADAARLAQVLHALQADQVSCWSKHQFLVRPNELLNGHSPRDVILDRDADLAQLLQIARNRYAGEQGAS